MTAILWMVAKATLILLVGLCGVEGARRSRASVRHLLLASTFAVLLVLPVVTLLAPPNIVEVASAQPPPTQLAPSAEVARLSPVPATNAGASATSNWIAAPSIASVSVASGPISRGGLIAALWASGASVLFALLASALFRLRCLRRYGSPWTSGDAIATELAREREVGRPVALALHKGVTTPMTYGAFRPRIVLPQDAPTWPESDLRRALTHELEHVRRGDWLVQLMARGVCALYWFHPLVWVAWRRLCLEGERACDDAVLQSADQTDYALQLVTLAERLSIDGPTPALSMANRSDLSVRVRAVLDLTQVRGRVGRATVAATLGMATAGVLLLAPLRVVAVERTAPDGGQVRTAAVAFVLPDRETHADPEVRVSRIEKRSRRVSRAIGELLVEAAGEGDIEAVVEMLDDGVDVNTVVEGDGTALIGAARGAQTRMVQLLLDRGAQPDLRSPGDGSPLIAAARDGSLDIVKILLDRGASIDLGAPGDGNPLIMAAGGGQLEMVRFLLDRGANIEAIVPGDENPLIQACAAGQAEVVKYLVSRGANINTRVWVDHDGRNRSGGWRSPLTMARRHGHRALVDYLLSQGASDVRE